MNPIPFVLPLFLGFSAQKQPLMFRRDLAEMPNMVQFQTSIGLNTSHLGSTFFYTVGNGDFLDEQIKSDVLSRIRTSGNAIGADLNSDISFTCMDDSLFGRGGWGYSVSFANRLIADANYGEGLFKMLLHGNARYAGETMPFGPVHADLTLYQQFQFSFFKSWIRDNSSSQFGLGVGFVQGNFNRRLKADRLDVFTDTAGAYVEFTAENMKLSSTDPDRMGYFYPNGVGAVTNFWFQHAWKRNTIYAAVNDAGFIRWNQQSEHISADTAWRWTGFYFPNITNVSENYFSDYADSLRSNYIVEETHVPYTTMLPMQVFLCYEHALPNEKLSFRAQASWRPFRQTYPAGWVSAVYAPAPWFEGQLLVGYGGYSSMFAGLDLGFKSKRNWVFSIQTRNLDSFWPNPFSSGYSFGFRLAKHFF